MISIILFILLISQSVSITDLYVGYPNKSKNFKTIQEAINEADLIKPKNEDERIIIHISPGIYRQQLIINTAYLSLINEEPEKEVKITWYYGIGYKYYSVGDNGLYNETRFKEKSNKTGDVWRDGATVHLRWRAAYFRAENITFENSFNRYITEEELEDGVEPINQKDIIRNKTTDLNTIEASKGACTFSAESDYSEFYNCKFLSCHSTIFSQASAQYYKNCFFEGQNGIIIGGGNVVFHSCIIGWKGFSKNSMAGCISSSLAANEPYTGYLFYKCKIVGNKNLNVTSGYFGSPWGSNKTKISFINTTLENEKMIAKEGWTALHCPPEEVDGFLEFGTKLKNGTLVDVSQRKGYIIPDIDFSKFNISSYLNNWTPYYINFGKDVDIEEEEDEDKEEEIKENEEEEDENKEEEEDENEEEEIKENEEEEIKENEKEEDENKEDEEEEDENEEDENKEDEEEEIKENEDENNEKNDGNKGKNEEEDENEDKDDDDNNNIILVSSIVGGILLIMILIIIIFYLRRKMNRNSEDIDKNFEKKEMNKLMDD